MDTTHLVAPALSELMHHAERRKGTLLLAHSIFYPTVSLGVPLSGWGLRLAGSGVLGLFLAGPAAENITGP